MGERRRFEQYKGSYVPQIGPFPSLSCICTFRQMLKKRLGWGSLNVRMELKSVCERGHEGRLPYNLEGYQIDVWGRLKDGHFWVVL